MVATGRVPNTKTLGLEGMDIETNRGFVQVSLCQSQAASGIVPDVRCIISRRMGKYQVSYFCSGKLAFHRNFHLPHFLDVKGT